MGRKLLFSFIIFFSACFEARPPAPQAPYHPLPWEYDGTYRWTGSAELSDVHIRWEEFHKEGEQSIAEGAAIYISPWKQKTRIRVRAHIDLETRSIEIWESEPSQPNFVTNGSHKGTLSEDLQQIETTWTTLSNGKTPGATGHLSLRANQDANP